ncbi:MAG: PIG-L family deacetylase [Chloroflexota bacterium]|nr:PIG-L family deacetylase [Chloroflexota bacterium]
MRILALAASPGDAEMCCGGTLARVTALRGAVAICTLGNGNSLGSDLTPRELADTHRAEAEAAAESLGAKLFWFGHSDFSVANDAVTRMQLVEVLRTFRPNALLAPASVDAHHDLRDAWRLALDAAHLAAAPSARTEQDPLDAPPAVCAYQPRWLEGFKPDTYVDVSDTIDAKQAAIAHLKTLAQWYMAQRGIDIAEAAETVSAYRGLQAGVDFAEAFAVTPIAGRAATTRILP